MPYILDAFPRSGAEFVIKCRRCRRATTLTVFEFHALPNLTPSDIDGLGLLDEVAKDLTLGGALDIKQARDLALAGLSLTDVHALEPPSVATPKSPAPRRKRK